MANGRSRLEYPIGKVLYESGGWVGGVRVSPDGRYLAFFDHQQFGNNDGFVKVVDASGGIRLAGPFVRGAGPLAWSKDGEEVWYSGIQATSLAGKSRQVWTSPFATLHDVARDGRVLFDVSAGRREMIGVAAPGAPPRNLTALNWSFPSDISEGTGTVLFYEQQVEPSAIYTRKLDGSPAVRIGDGEGYGISPDGKWAVTVRLPDRHPLVLLPTGAGESRTVDIGALTCQWANWFPDGRRILMAANESGRGARLYVQDVAGGKPRPITGEGMRLSAQAISPDGRAIIARGPDGRLAVYPAEPGEPHFIPDLPPGDAAIGWTADGKAVFVMALSGVPGVVRLVDVATGRQTKWKEFMPPDPTGVEQVGPAVISPDEKSYVYSYRLTLSDLYLATGMK
jgi:Tol biopolymer transport system component